MNTEMACPLCYADLSYGDGSTHSRRIGFIIPWIFDGVLCWECPQCHGRWHRFPDGHPRHELAQRYIRPSIRTGSRT